MSTMLEPPRLDSLEGPPPRRRRASFFGRFSRRTYIIGGVVLALVLGIAVWLLFFSSVFGVRNIVVEGVRVIQPSEIGQRAELRSGEPLAGIDTGAIESRVRGIAAVDSVNVSRRWPNTVVIDVVERARVGVIKLDTGYAVLDANGYPFEQVKKRPRGLPILDAPEGPIRAAVVAVAASLPPDILSAVATIHADSAESVVLEMRSGATVFWGSPADAELKAQVLRALIAKKKYKWFDVRSPESPTSAAASPVPAPPPSPTPTDSASPPSESASATPDAAQAPGATPVPQGSAGVLIPAPRVQQATPTVTPSSTPSPAPSTR
ncbi:MAG: cell division protein FtsQ/DivIB [Candidatus Nanopelagicales bacterium]